jgi:hypothetical protein
LAALGALGGGPVHGVAAPLRRQMVDEIKRTVAAFYRQIGRRDLEVYVRLQITRGSGPIGLDIALADRPEFVLLVQRNPSWSEAQARDGLHLSLATESPPQSGRQSQSRVENRQLFE